MLSFLSLNASQQMATSQLSLYSIINCFTSRYQLDRAFSVWKSFQSPSDLRPIFLSGLTGNNNIMLILPRWETCQGRKVFPNSLSRPVLAGWNGVPQWLKPQDLEHSPLNHHSWRTSQFRRTADQRRSCLVWILQALWFSIHSKVQWVSSFCKGHISLQ